MNNDKIECKKCHKKFLILNREHFPCINCHNLIIVEKQKVTNNKVTEETELEYIEDKDDLDLLNIEEN